MNYLSLFSGIEAASVAWQPLGFKPVAFAEIEPFACALLRQHYPDVPNLGDVMGITEGQIAALGPIDVVVGGSPCQDLSLAGRREGILGESSGLFFEQMRLFHAARKHCGARFLIWENVPGCFNSGQGRDFTGVVAMLAGCRLPVPEGGWQSEGVALGEQGLVEWAVLDAQFFGLAQRRKRVFAVLDTGNWHARPPILLEPDRLRGNTAPRRTARQNPAPHLETSTRSRQQEHSTFRLLSFGEYAASKTASTIKSRDYKDNTGNLILCPPPASVPTLYGIHSSQSPITCSEVGHGLSRNNEQENAVYTVAERARSGGQNLEYRNDGTANTLLNPNGGRSGLGIGAVATPASIRRLTPLECERLQGFPDNYTRIAFGGTPAAQCPDKPRYQVLGNSMAVPVMSWIGKQLQAAIQCAHYGMTSRNESLFLL